MSVADVRSRRARRLDEAPPTSVSISCTSASFSSSPRSCSRRCSSGSASSSALARLACFAPVGIDAPTVRRLLTTEAVLPSIGARSRASLGAIGYAWLVVKAFDTWWVDAVGTTALTVHVAPCRSPIGAVGGIAAAIVCTWWTLRGLGRNLRAKPARRRHRCRRVDRSAQPDARPFVAASLVCVGAGFVALGMDGVIAPRVSSALARVSGCRPVRVPACFAGPSRLALAGAAGGRYRGSVCAAPRIGRAGACSRLGSSRRRRSS